MYNDVTSVDIVSNPLPRKDFGLARSMLEFRRTSLSCLIQKLHINAVIE